MTGRSTPTCSDVIVAFQQASQTVGVQNALDVIQRFNAQYAASVQEIHRATVIAGLTALVRTHTLATSEPDPSAAEAVKAKWRKVA